MAGEAGGRALPLDVTDPASVAAFAAAAGAEVAVLVCHAGGALGLGPVGELDERDEERSRTLWETNVLGVTRCGQAFLPALIAGGDGRVVVVTSVAGHQTYPGGAGYTGAKHAAAAWSTPCGWSCRAAGVYAGLTPLSADDVADAITWAVTRPPHVVAARIDLFPRDRASARDAHRRP